MDAQILDAVVIVLWGSTLLFDNIFLFFYLGCLVYSRTLLSAVFTYWLFLNRFLKIMFNC